MAKESPLLISKMTIIPDHPRYLKLGLSRILIASLTTKGHHLTVNMRTGDSRIDLKRLSDFVLGLPLKRVTQAAIT